MPENKPPLATFADDRQALMEELIHLRDALRRKGHASLGPSCSGLILARLCAGITLAEWNEVAHEGGFLHWLALPASGEALPHLTQIQQTLEELTHETQHDPMTGLANRRAFERTLKLELERASRAGTSLTLALLDLDDFKVVNDTHGHLCGDRVLVALAGIILNNKRSYDLAARIGGEEFAVILPGSGLMQAEATMQRLIDEVRERKVVCEGVDKGVSVSVSVGLACTKGRIPLSLERFLDLADKALYEAKATGKDRIVKAPIPDLLETPTATLVHSQEKQFLFTGPDT